MRKSKKESYLMKDGMKLMEQLAEAHRRVMTAKLEEQHRAIANDRAIDAAIRGEPVMDADTREHLVKMAARVAYDEATNAAIASALLRKGDL